MRRIAGSRKIVNLALVSLLIFFWVSMVHASAYEQEGDSSIEGSVGIGVGIGFGYKVDNEQLRIDIRYYKWENSNIQHNISVFLGGRKYVLSTPKVKPFLEFGLSLNFFRAESEKETKVAAVPGLGLEYMVSPRLGLGVDLRHHFMDKGVGEFTEGKTSFSSAAATIGYHF